MGFTNIAQYLKGDIIEVYYGVAKTGLDGNTQFRIKVSTTQGSVAGNVIIYQQFI